jgi:cytochrome c biogenesis protein CcmG/thiol:disulfide interchange protein DsbE
MTGSGLHKLLIVVGAAGLAAALGMAGLLLSQRDTTDFSPGASLKAGEAAPAFTLALQGGGNFALADRNGKPLLLNFFASWCLPCRDEMPAIEKISREYRAKGVAFVGVAVDDTQAGLREFTARYGVSFPVGLDKGAAIRNSFGLAGVPTTYFIDRKGIVSHFHSGAVTEELLRHELDKLL